MELKIERVYAKVYGVVSINGKTFDVEIPEELYSLSKRQYKDRVFSEKVNSDFKSRDDILNISKEEVDEFGVRQG